MFASVPLPAALAVFPQRVLPQVTLTGLRKLFWLQLPVLLLRWSSVCWVYGVFGAALGFPPCAVLFFRDLRFWADSPAAGCLPEDSATVCLACYCGGGFGWAATLPLCSQCFSCAGWPAGVCWVLHPVSGSSYGCCDCSLGDSVGVPYGSPSLSSFVSCSVISCSSHPLWVLYSVHCLVSLAFGWVCGVYGTCSLWGLLSRLPLVVVLLLRSLLVLHLLLRWGGLVTRLWPLLLLLCFGLLWGLCCAVLSPWSRARPTLSGLRLWIPMVSWSKLLVFSWPLYCGSFLSLPMFTDGSGVVVACTS